MSASKVVWTEQTDPISGSILYEGTLEGDLHISLTRLTIEGSNKLSDRYRMYLEARWNGTPMIMLNDTFTADTPDQAKIVALDKYTEVLIRHLQLSQKV